MASGLRTARLVKAPSLAGAPRPPSSLGVELDPWLADPPQRGLPNSTRRVQGWAPSSEEQPVGAAPRAGRQGAKGPSGPGLGDLRLETLPRPRAATPARPDARRSLSRRMLSKLSEPASGLPFPFLRRLGGCKPKFLTLTGDCTEVCAPLLQACVGYERLKRRHPAHYRVSSPTHLCGENV